VARGAERQCLIVVHCHRNPHLLDVLPEVVRGHPFTLDAARYTGMTPPEPLQILFVLYALRSRVREPGQPFHRIPHFLFRGDCDALSGFL